MPARNNVPCPARSVQRARAYVGTRHPSRRYVSLAARIHVNTLTGRTAGGVR